VRRRPGASRPIRQHSRPLRSVAPAGPRKLRPSGTRTQALALRAVRRPRVTTLTLIVVVSPARSTCGFAVAPRLRLAGAGPGTQEELVPEALRRANAYLEAGVDCVFPITLWETDALRRFTSEAGGPVNVVRLPQAPLLAELAALGVARVSWGILLHGEAMGRFEGRLALLAD
jgi:Phosphoenolpyruvate phosphomutase